MKDCGLTFFSEGDADDYNVKSNNYFKWQCIFFTIRLRYLV